MFLFFPPTEMEKLFLAIITAKFPELRRQVEECRISLYDPTGYYYFYVPPHNSGGELKEYEGPQIVDDSRGESLELILSTLGGCLYSIEIVNLGLCAYPCNIVEYFMDAYKNGHVILGQE